MVGTNRLTISVPKGNRAYEKVSSPVLVTAHCTVVAAAVYILESLFVPSQY